MTALLRGVRVTALPYPLHLPNLKYDRYTMLRQSLYCRVALSRVRETCVCTELRFILKVYSRMYRVLRAHVPRSPSLLEKKFIMKKKSVTVLTVIP